MYRFFLLASKTRMRADYSKGGGTAYIVVSLFVLTILSILLFFYYSNYCRVSATFPHFRTNILTGDCEFGTGDSLCSADPWYYRSDCDPGKKAGAYSVLSNQRYGIRKGQCELNCYDIDVDDFCAPAPQSLGDYGPTDIECYLIVQCKAIKCP